MQDLLNTPAMYQRLCANNDSDGRIQRVYVILNISGGILQTIGETYAGRPEICRDLIQLPTINVSVKEYKSFLKFKVTQ